MALGFAAGRPAPRNKRAAQSPKAGMRSLLWRLTLALVVGFAGVRAANWVADRLTARAWQRTLAGERHAKPWPWPWATAWPVARLSVPSLGVVSYVLASERRGAAEVGARHISGTALPGKQGNSVIDATHDGLRGMLPELPLGTEIILETVEGTQRHFTVRYALVLDERDTWIAKQEGPNRLTLTARMPLPASPSGAPARIAVWAYEAERGAPSARIGAAVSSRAPHPG